MTLSCLGSRFASLWKVLSTDLLRKRRYISIKTEVLAEVPDLHVGLLGAPAHPLDELGSELGLEQFALVPLYEPSDGLGLVPLAELGLDDVEDTIAAIVQRDEGLDHCRHRLCLIMICY